MVIMCIIRTYTSFWQQLPFTETLNWIKSPLVYESLFPYLEVYTYILIYSLDMHGINFISLQYKKNWCDLWIIG